MQVTLARRVVARTGDETIAPRRRHEIQARMPARDHEHRRRQRQLAVAPKHDVQLVRGAEVDVLALYDEDCRERQANKAKFDELALGLATLGRVGVIKGLGGGRRRLRVGRRRRREIESHAR